MVNDINNVYREEYHLQSIYFFLSLSCSLSNGGTCEIIKKTFYNNNLGGREGGREGERMDG